MSDKVDKNLRISALNTNKKEERERERRGKWNVSDDKYYYRKPNSCDFLSPLISRQNLCMYHHKF